jgi:micrococcal nuclease
MPLVGMKFFGLTAEARALREELFPKLKAGMICTALVLAVPDSCEHSRIPPADRATICRVERVSDGDSFYCNQGKRVRLIGIDTPELSQGELGRQSREALLRLMPPGSELRLELDATPADRYGRILAYGWRDSVMVNREMVRQGWALLYTVPPNVRYVESLRAAQDSAQSEHAGHWKSGGFTCQPAQRRRREC